MPIVTFSLPTVVAVKIRGEHQEHPTKILVPDDGGLVGRYLKWAMEQEIFTVIQAGYSGGGGYLGFYSPDDAAKIRAWLETNGAVEDDEKTWERR